MGTDAVRVYDLDGTLVRLAVDWDAVRADAAAVFEEAGAGAAAEGADLWALLDVAPDHGLRNALEATIAQHERDGAAASERLPAADVLAGGDRPAGVCSLNCEAACRIALERHDLTDHVGAVVGRDSVETRKPDPAPLLATIERLDADPADAVFIGDSERDAVTADRAGVRFESVESFLARQ